MLRILHILDHSLPLHSGYSFRTAAILAAQRAAGLEVRGLTGLRHTAAGPPAEVLDDLIFHRTPRAAKGPLVLRNWHEVNLLADAITALAHEWRPALLHAHSPALCGQAALIASKRLGIPLVYDIRAFWEDAAVAADAGREGDLKYLLVRLLESHVCAAADAVVTICQGLRDDLVGRGIEPAKITIVPNGVDLARFGKAAAPDPALAAELGLGSGPVIGFIGSFYDYEGLDDLIAAMPALLQHCPTARLLLVGGGPQADRLQAQARASPVRAAIRFVGRVPHDQVSRYYALADVMAYPRKQCRLTELVTPLKPLEAMAQGKLVAASMVGGHRELIVNGLTGTMFAPDDPAACAAALIDLLNAPDSWDSLRQAGRAHIAKNYDWALNVNLYHAVYQILLGRSNGCTFPAAA